MFNRDFHDDDGGVGPFRTVADGGVFTYRYLFLLFFFFFLFNDFKKRFKTNNDSCSAIDFLSVTRKTY